MLLSECIQVFATRQEKSKLYENLVALHFFKKGEGLYYWFGNNEVDLSKKRVSAVGMKKTS
ncbi:MAG: hypothetical protein ACQESP_12380 [Candidatus Muiribacteriota bacterium]